MTIVTNPNQLFIKAKWNFATGDFIQLNELTFDSFRIKFNPLTPQQIELIINYMTDEPTTTNVTIGKLLVMLINNEIPFNLKFQYVHYTNKKSLTANIDAFKKIIKINHKIKTEVIKYQQP